MQEYNADMKKIGFSVVLATLVLLAVPVASAQSDAQVLQSVRACQAVSGLSERLACYDRVLPPGTSTVGTVATVATERATETIDRGAPVASREQELEATVADLEQRLLEENPDEIPTARIIEVQRPTVRSSRLIAEDGRVFVESSSTTIVRWPDTPFDVSVSTTLTGTINITAIDESQLNRGQGRGTGRGVRVTLER
jgi:hypothetical protein